MVFESPTSSSISNRLLRQFLAKGADLSEVTQERLDEIARLLNSRAGQTLGWKFPVEVLVEYLALSQSNTSDHQLNVALGP